MFTTTLRAIIRENPAMKDAVVSNLTTFVKNIATVLSIASKDFQVHFLWRLIMKFLWFCDSLADLFLTLNFQAAVVKPNAIPNFAHAI